jgi:O-antigen/teichoic acid export membrane protein
VATTAGDSGRFGRDVVLAGAGNALRTLRTLVLIPILAGSLGAGDYGVWTQVKVTVTLLVPLALLGVNAALVRFLGGEPRPAAVRVGFSSAVTATLAAGAVLVAAVWLGAGPAAAAILGGADVAGLLRLAAVLALLEGLDQLSLAYFQTFRRMPAHAAFVAVEVVGELVLMGTLSATGHGVAALLGAAIGWKAVIVAGKLVRIWTPGGPAAPDPATIRRYVTFGIPMMMSGLLYFVLNYGDRYLVGWLLGIREVGIYAVAYGIGTIPFLLMTPVDYIYYPTVTALWNRGELGEVRRCIRQCLGAVLAIGVPAVVGVAALGAPLVTLVSGPEFLPAAGSVPVIAVAFLAFGIGVVGERVVLVGDGSRTVTAVSGAVAALNVGLNLLLVPRLGIGGAALATLLSFVAYAALTLGLARRHVAIDADVVLLLKVVASTLVMLVAITNLGPAAGVLVGAAGGAIAYLATLAALRGVAIGELRAMLRGQ